MSAVQGDVASDDAAENASLPTVAGCVVEEALGRGAFATVFLGRDSQSWKRVAVKQVLKLPYFAAGHNHEYMMTKRLSHPNIVKPFDCRREQDGVFIIFEYANGGDFYDRLERAETQPISRSICRKYLFEVASALQYCHSKGIVHGDVKLENMLINDGLIKLCDFGLAGMIDEVRVGRPYGTSAYMAPELVCIRSRSATYKLDTSQDVWSMGIVFFAVLFNDLPWEKAMDSDTDYAGFRKSKNPVANHPQMGYLSPELQALMSGMLACDPHERISMADVAVYFSESRPWFRSQSKKSRQDTSATSSGATVSSVAQQMNAMRMGSAPE